MDIHVKIPSFRKIVTDSEKSFTVFCVEVYNGHHRHSIEKRYTDFEELHRKLKRSLDPPHLPPKNVMKWSHKVLESRRLGFQHYLQGVLSGGKIPKSLLRFLELNLHSNSMDSLDDLTDGATSHQPLLAFSENSFLSPQQKGSLPDILVAGVIQGLYEPVDDPR